MLLLLMMLSCGQPDIPVKTEDIINRWWCTENTKLAFYLQKIGDQRTSYYTYWDEDPEFEDIYLGGEWWRLDTNKFEIEYGDNSYVVKTTEEGDCYKVSVSIFGDTACACEDML